MLLLALVLSALAVGLDNFAAAIGIGLAGVDTRTRWRVALVFGCFEGAMPLVGLVVGHSSAHSLGNATRYVGGALLMVIGVWSLGAALSDTFRAADDDGARVALGQSLGVLVVTAFALSIDNLVVGFGLGVTKTPLVAALVVFALVSVALTLAGLEVGSALGGTMKPFAESIAGVVLIAVGVLIAAGVL